MGEIKNYLVKNECYIKGKNISEFRGVLIHSTATPGATPERFANKWNAYRPGGRQVCVHAFADDKKVINTLPYNMRCWGCGGSGNSHYIQVEICEPKGIYFGKNWEYLIKTGYEQSVKEYILRASEVVIDWIVNRLLELGIHEVNKKTVTSHYEAHLMGLASNHGDPRGLLGLAGLNMDIIRERAGVLLKQRLQEKADIVDKEEDLTDTKPAVGDFVKFKPEAIQFNGKAIPANYISKIYKIKSIDNRTGRTVITIGDVVMYAVHIKSLVKYNKGSNNSGHSFTSYKIRVTDEALNIRKGPGISYPIVGCIKDKGVYTIIEEDSTGKWGRLKSGAGWIHLGYTRKI